LPQIVGTDILLLLLNIFKIFPEIKIGYNSLGGAASVNHLHFHVFFSEELIGSEKMPIQDYPRKEWIKSSLINPQEEINLVTVFLTEVFNWHQDLRNHRFTSELFCFGSIEAKGVRT
jgi:hypothetical protein